MRGRQAAWPVIEGVAVLVEELLKDTLVAVILIYLLVDFTTDWPETEGELSWQMLAKPLSILALAAAFRLFAAIPSEARTAGDR
jgi:hypothetical protein